MQLEPTETTLRALLDGLAAAVCPQGSPRYWTATLRHEGLAEGMEERVFDADGPRYLEIARPTGKQLPFASGFDGVLAWEQSPAWDGWFGARHPKTRAERFRPAPLWQLGDPSAVSLLGEAELDDRRCYVVARDEPDAAGPSRSGPSSTRRRSAPSRSAADTGTTRSSGTRRLG